MKTLLDGVNEVLKRVQIIQGDSSVLSSLTDSARQVYIDTAIQIWNETVDDLYSVSETPKPNVLSEKQITLVANSRDYSLHSSLVRLHFPLHDETNGNYMTEYPGGYMQLKADQAYPDNYTGLPDYAVINPKNGKLYLDKLPTSNEAGRIYKYQFEKDLVLSSATDQFPFKDIVFRALVPAVAEVWRLTHKKSGNEGVYRNAVGRASRLLRQVPNRSSWAPRRYVNGVDPYAH